MAKTSWFWILSPYLVMDDVTIWNQIDLILYCFPVVCPTEIAQIYHFRYHRFNCFCMYPPLITVDVLAKNWNWVFGILAFTLYAISSWAYNWIWTRLQLVCQFLPVNRRYMAVRRGQKYWVYDHLKTKTHNGFRRKNGSKAPSTLKAQPSAATKTMTRLA